MAQKINPVYDQVKRIMESAEHDLRKLIDNSVNETVHSVQDVAKCIGIPEYKEAAKSRYLRADARAEVIIQLTWLLDELSNEEQ